MCVSLLASQRIAKPRKFCVGMHAQKAERACLENDFATQSTAAEATITAYNCLINSLDGDLAT